MNLKESSQRSQIPRYRVFPSSNHLKAILLARLQTLDMI